MTSRQDECSKHIPSFDESAAEDILKGWVPKTDAEWLMGNPQHAEVRRRWPRFNGQCECGYFGICYASMAHYTMGDW